MRTKLSNRGKIALLFSAIGAVACFAYGAIEEFANGPWSMIEAALLGAIVGGIAGMIAGYEVSPIALSLMRLHNWMQNWVQKATNPKNAVRRTTCPICETPLPKYRIRTTVQQFLFGGCNCDRCGCEVDRFGNEVKS